MSRQRVIVCSPQVPFFRGGTEVLAETLVAHLNRGSAEAEWVQLPFRSWPHEAVLRSAALWRLLDLDQTEAQKPIDRVIATKFPSYFVRHPRKVVWLVHQFRQVYDWYDSELSPYNRPRPDDYQLVRWIADQDRQALEEAESVYAISENVRKRLRHYLGLDAKVLYPPPPCQGEYRCEDYTHEILLVQRLEPAKRTALAIRSLRHVRSDFRASIVGAGPEEERLRDLVKDLDLENQIRFVGRVPRQELLRMYSKCRMVLHVPLDEDYGFVPIEAFASRKPVVTASDSGGPLEFVHHEGNGWVADPDPAALARGIQTLLDDERLAESWGSRGFEKIRDLSWDRVAAVLMGKE